MHLRVHTPFFILAGTFCILTATALSAQENSHWNFGHYAGIDFSSGSAVACTGGLDALEGTTTVSDQGGNLLFYTDGITIRDRNNNVMPNGTGLMGGASSTQAALIVPGPGACGTYYVFTTQDHLQNGDFRYSVVDMCLNNGFGDVVAGEKNIMISTPCGEKVTAVPNSSGTGYWIITHVLGGDAFLAYSLTNAGLNSVPVTSSVGAVQASICQIGPLKASHDGTKLVCTNTFCNNAELLDFDAATGVVSNPVDLMDLYGLPNGSYGAEFSPNDELLYIATTWGVNTLYQIDLVNSVVWEIAQDPGGDYHFGALQLGADGRIYLARTDEAFLDVIEFPDIPGTACTYVPAGLPLAAGTTSDMGLPCLVPAAVLPADTSAITVDLGPDTSFCNGTATLAPLNACGDIFLWQDSSVASSFTVAEPGIFWVRVSNSCGVAADTIVVGNVGQALADLGPDTALCPGSTVGTFRRGTACSGRTGAPTMNSRSRSPASIRSKFLMVDARDRIPWRSPPCPNHKPDFLFPWTPAREPSRLRALPKELLNRHGTLMTIPLARHWPPSIPIQSRGHTPLHWWCRTAVVRIALDRKWTFLTSANSN
jgi:hypothetical protein